MSNFSQGFLSEPFDEVRSVVREKYANWREVLMCLNEQCVGTQHELSVKNMPLDLLGATLFAHTIASSQAAIILLEHGLLSQAKTVLRSALESLFALAAIEAKPELAKQLAQSQEAEKRSMADKALQWKGEELRASLLAQINEADLHNMKASSASGFNTAQLADHAGMMDWYLSIYALLSFPAHSKLSDLASHLITDDHGNIMELRSEPDVENQESVWAFAIEIEIRAASAVNTIFGTNIVDVQKYKNALSVLSSPRRSD